VAISLEKRHHTHVPEGDIIPLLAPTRSSAPDTPGNHDDIDLPDAMGNDQGISRKTAVDLSEIQHNKARHTEARAAHRAAQCNTDTVAWTAWLEIVRSLARAAAQKDHHAAMLIARDTQD
jgi:hypothetical protein